MTGKINRSASNPDEADDRRQPQDIAKKQEIIFPEKQTGPKPETLSELSDRRSEALIIGPGEPENQRAQRLIDQAEAELDARKAIKLLYEALRLGLTGRQAAGAYQALGLRFEDLRQKKRALDYYTKAVSAAPPTAQLLFWRGRLYYQLGRWPQAKSDLERAVAFPPGEGLLAADYALARRYLANL